MRQTPLTDGAEQAQVCEPAGEVLSKAFRIEMGFTSARSRECLVGLGAEIAWQSRTLRALLVSALSKSDARSTDRSQTPWNNNVKPSWQCTPCPLGLLSVPWVAPMNY